MEKKILRNWDPKETRLKNIERKVRILDRDTQFYQGVPIPSWIELSVIDACNRTCPFCPKADDSIAPNSYQKMTTVLVDKLCIDLKKINFEGAFCLSGYGEPTLHNGIHEIIYKLSVLGAVELITNGDTLTEKKIVEYYDSNLSKLIISMYDGEHQIEKFKEMEKKSGVPKDFLVLRNTWYNKEEDFGLLLTNRAGTNSYGNQPEINPKRNCFYPAYTSVIEWNGDIFLCCHDWQRRISMGNVMQTEFYEIWNGPIYRKYRKDLLAGNRKNKPCSNCNANGTIHGHKHAKDWKKNYKI
ncbi:MAG: SPASM domain-containing protein [Pelagibacteraceae bacterium]|jgi:radical SAM protein with 4Fe4S-binding SPASM domain|nr:SPASM domain-containing protein [Pelagibacteraceae bacterium]